jgi:putative membrane protein
MKRMGLLPLFCAAVLAVGCNTNKTADNQNEPAAVGTAGEADRTAVHDGDKDFVNSMLSDGMAEVELGRMASQRAVNPDVKRFGQMMVDDHSKAGADLKQIATMYNVPMAPQNEDKHRDLMDRLSKLRGAEFDKEYMKAMVDGHEDVVDNLQGRVDSTASLKEKITEGATADKQVVPEKSDNAVTASVNAWAAQTLPVVRRHLDEAKSIHDRLDRNGRTNETARNNKVRTEK